MIPYKEYYREKQGVNSMGGRGGGSGRGGGAGGGSSSKRYAPGWDPDALQNEVVKDVQGKNKVNLKIRKDNIDSDIKKLKKNISQLSKGTKQDIKQISSYQNTIDRLQQIKKYIQYSEKML